jgi:peroxiredoxin
MEKQNDPSESHQNTVRFPWPLLGFVLAGLGLSAVFIILSFTDLLSGAGESLSAALSVTTEAAIVDDASAFTTGPLPDPRAGSVADSGRAAGGQPAPDFTLPTLEGDAVSLSDYRGRPVLMNFWATWCVPCRQEMPELVRAYNAHQDEGFVVLAVDLADQDSLDDVRAFVAEFDMSFPVLLDQTGAVYNELYRLLGLPMSVFVNRDGVITRIHIGLMTADQIDTFVSEILE